MYENHANRTRYGDPLYIAREWRGVPNSPDGYLHKWYFTGTDIIDEAYFFTGELSLVGRKFPLFCFLPERKVVQINGLRQRSRFVWTVVRTAETKFIQMIFFLSSHDALSDFAPTRQLLAFFFLRTELPTLVNNAPLQLVCKCHFIRALFLAKSCFNWIVFQVEVRNLCDSCCELWLWLLVYYHKAGLILRNYKYFEVSAEVLFSVSPVLKLSWKWMN